MTSKSAVVYLDDIAKKTKDRFIIDGLDPYMQAYWIKAVAKYYGIAADGKIVLNASGASAKKIIGALGQSDLLISRYLVIIENMDLIQKTDLKELLKAYSASPAVIICLYSVPLYMRKKGMREKAKDVGVKDEHNFFRNILNKSCILDARKKTEYGILEWIRKKTKDLPLRSNQEQLIFEFTGTNLAEIETAVEKLRLAFRSGPLANADIREILNCRREVSSWRAVNMLLSGNTSGALRMLDSLKRTQSPKRFIKNLSETIRKSILAKEIKTSGKDPTVFAGDFGMGWKFAQAWEVPIASDDLARMYIGLLPFFRKNSYLTWEDVENYVYCHKSIF